MSRLRQRWITLILHTTAFIHRRKEALLTAHAAGAFFVVLSLIAAELFLAVISIPLYLTTSSQGMGAEGAVQYRVRRVATLTILTCLLIVWLLKLAFGFGAWYAASSRYSVRETEPAPSIETFIPGAIALPLNPRLPVPAVTSVTLGADGSVIIRGTAEAQQTVLVSFQRAEKADTSGQLTLYMGGSDARGEWTVVEDHARSLLQPGSYAVTASIHDQAHSMRSNPSAAVPFTLHAPWWSALTARTDVFLNIAVIGLVALGVLVALVTA